MKYRWIEDIHEFKGIAKEWDDLLFSSTDDNPFLLSDFIITWWKHYHNNRRLMVFCMYEDGGIIGGIPLCKESRRFMKTISYVGGAAANLTHFILGRSEFNAMESLVYSLEKKSDWDILVLDRVLSGNPVIGDTGDTAGRFSDKFFCDVTDFGLDGRIDLTMGYENVLNRLPRRLRRYLKSGKERLADIGELRLRKINGASNITKLFDDYRELSIKSFDARNDISAFKSKTFSNFFRDLLCALGEKNMLDAHRLAVHDNTLAISFGYRFKKGFKWILTAFNPLFQDLRPGHLLIEALVREAIKNGDPYFDMYYGGGLYYKQQWCTQFIPLHKVEIYKKSFLNRFIVLTERKLRANPLMFNSAKKAARTFRKFFVPKLRDAIGTRAPMDKKIPRKRS